MKTRTGIFVVVLTGYPAVWGWHYQKLASRFMQSLEFGYDHMARGGGEIEWGSYPSNENTRETKIAVFKSLNECYFKNFFAA